MAASEPRPRASGSGRRRMRHGLAAVVTATVVALIPTGCSDGTRPSGSASPTSDGSSPAAPPPGLTVHTRITRIAGDLAAHRRAALRRQVKAVLDQYVGAAFGSAPEAGAAFAAFTAGVRPSARRDRDVLMWTAPGDLDAATATAYLNVFAPANRPAGVTARLEVVGATDAAQQPAVVLRGRLLLTPAAPGWRIFGYDVAGADGGGTS